MNFRKITYLIFFGILIYLLVINLNNVDIVPLYNRDFYTNDRNEIETIQNLDSLKTKANELVDQRQKMFLYKCSLAEKNYKIILILIAIQIGLLIYKKRERKSQNRLE